MTSGTASPFVLLIAAVALAWQVGPRGHAGEPSALPDLPEAVTSFGAAVLDGALYVYGGHQGDAHSYWDGSQGHTLWKLDLKKPVKWEAVAEGPPLQGLALVACQDKLYRLGGFKAVNKEGEEHDLWSQRSVDGFDPRRGEWVKAPSLPEPRSSFDAAELNGKIYVIGGWSLQGAGKDSEWLDTAYCLDPAKEPAKWQALPKPPFKRRALAVAAYAGKIYAIGGMQQRGGPTTRVDVYDPAKKLWTQGPSLIGEPMNGFGASAFATGGKLYVSTMDGSLQVLTPDGSQWQVVQKLPSARFFHRMLPLNDRQLVIIGGAHMSEGKYTKLEVIDLK